MIEYDPSPFQLGTVFRWRGSVFPRAFVFGCPAGLVSVVLQYLGEGHGMNLDLLTDTAAYSAFAFVVGFLLVFRTSQAYTRFWEGTTLMQLLRGQWVGAFSSILAFSVVSTQPSEQVEEFRHKLIRLFSLLHASALQYVSTMCYKDEQFNVIGIKGFDDRTVQFIDETDEDTKIYVIIQWIQQLILANLNTGILPVAPPIVSRVFQDLSTGIVTLNNARKISDTPFPFPYAQMVTVILLIHLIVTPVFIATWTTHWFWAFGFTFMSVFTMWSINFIAAEIEQPFGGDVNDIELAELQYVFNRCLVAMLNPKVSKMPTLKPEAWGEQDCLAHADTVMNTLQEIVERRGRVPSDSSDLESPVVHGAHDPSTKQPRASGSPGGPTPEPAAPAALAAPCAPAAPALSTKAVCVSVTGAEGATAETRDVRGGGGGGGHPTSRASSQEKNPDPDPELGGQPPSLSQIDVMIEAGNSLASADHRGPDRPDPSTLQDGHQEQHQARRPSQPREQQNQPRPLQVGQSQTQRPTRANVLQGPNGFADHVGRTRPTDRERSNPSQASL